MAHHLQSTDQSLEQTITQLLELGLNDFIMTDISRDGRLQGLNLSFYKKIRKRFPHLNLTASGGISQIRDLQQAQNLGLSGTIMGRAVLEQSFSWQEALSC